MALPKAPREPADETGKVFLISFRNVSYGDKGEKAENDTPQYQLGVFASSLEAEKTCVRMNKVLWRQKEYEFRSERQKEYRLHAELQEKHEELLVQGMESEPPSPYTEIIYNELAREKDQEDNYYYVVPLEVNE